VHAGILARRDEPAHMQELSKQGFEAVDLVVVNLYPFVETVSKPGVGLDEALENIDIGGPTMIRASAKNFPHVLVVVDPNDYEAILALLKEGNMPLEERRRLAQKAFQHVAMYDTAVSQYLRRGEGPLPSEMTIALSKVEDLRYGENPHQTAALYREEITLGTITPGILVAEQLHGKALSFNNYLDADAAWKAVQDFGAPTVAIIKHTNPCGLASSDDLTEAYRRALAGDPVSAFGGIVAINRRLDLTTAQEVAKTFYEIIIGPGFEDEALAVLQKKRDLRLLVVRDGNNGAAPLDVRRIGSGFLVQTADTHADADLELRTVTKREPTEEEMSDLRFAWKVAKHIKSNAIVVAKDNMLLGMGAGQPNRVNSVFLALRAAGEQSRGAALASDAFFPFPDSIEQAAEGGITSIVQPGGSIRDDEVIKAADERGIAMVFTGIRHFRH
jgi:phosphoribosylaminoimidazolecarboxamide formyltransferase/IMP cyclohydrolase